MAKPKKAEGGVDTRHYDVIVSPHITEKATLLSEHNAVVFKVAPKRDQAARSRLRSRRCSTSRSQA